MTGIIMLLSAKVLLGLASGVIGTGDAHLWRQQGISEGTHSETTRPRLCC